MESRRLARPGATAATLPDRGDNRRPSLLASCDVRWVKALLGLSDEPSFTWQDEPSFTVAGVDSPLEMEVLLRSKIQDGYGARLTAGYCWPWSDPRPDGTLVDDVRIGPRLSG